MENSGIQQRSEKGKAGHSESSTPGPQENESFTHCSFILRGKRKISQKLKSKLYSKNYSWNWINLVKLPSQKTIVYDSGGVSGSISAKKRFFRLEVSIKYHLTRVSFPPVAFR